VNKTHDKYGTLIPGTDSPIGQLGAIAQAVDQLKVQSDRILEWYLTPDARLVGGTACDLGRGLDEVRRFTQELKGVRFAGDVEECETISYLDDPAFVRAVRDVINQYREERKKR
jgi:hypothetical protein